MRLEGLYKAFDQRKVLSHFDLTLPQTGIIGFFGPSGCGKTTLFSLLAKISAPDGGLILDRPVPVSCVFQEDRLLPWSTALENVQYGAGVKEEVARRFLHEVGLIDACQQYPRQMSGGMNRRVAFARALAFPSCLLLLDEPFSGIDQKNREVFYQLLKERRQKQLICIISHDKEELTGLCDEVIELSGPPLTVTARNKI